MLAVHLAVKSDASPVFWAAWFFWPRPAHAVVDIAGIPCLRTRVFTLAWVALPVLAVQLPR